MNILLTGGAGFIGSHTAVALIEVGHSVFIVDNFCNSDPSIISHIEEIVKKKIAFIKSDIRDSAALLKFIKANQIDAVIHFAGLKAVGESSKIPLEYYANNVEGTISLLQVMEQCGIAKLVFSSSATVYGDPQYQPIDEDHLVSPTNAYGRTKLHIEHMLEDLANSNSKWKIISLRYFNPGGAHASGVLGEKPKGAPNNLLPYIAKVAADEISTLTIYGNQYPTKDGTGVRDYIHVMDLAEGHCAAVSYLARSNGYEVFNLGTGTGYSVLEILNAYELACGKKISYVIGENRIGDIASCFANCDKASRVLGWKASRTLSEMCSSSWFSKLQLLNSDK